jgi:hypothetical protein
MKRNQMDGRTTMATDPSPRTEPPTPSAHPTPPQQTLRPNPSTSSNAPATRTEADRPAAPGRQIQAILESTGNKEIETPGDTNSQSGEGDRIGLRLGGREKERRSGELTLPAMEEEGDVCAAAARGPVRLLFDTRGGGVFAETSFKEVAIRERVAATD